MNPIETYFRELYDIRSTGAAVPETSYYPALSNLLNAIGQTLKPRVRCVINLKNRGAGIPDGGLFTPDQFQRGGDGPIQGSCPRAARLKSKARRTTRSSRPRANRSPATSGATVRCW